MNMSLNLLDAVKSYFDNTLLNQSAGYLGESDATVKRSLDAVIPVTLAGIARKAETDPDTVFNLAKEAYSSGITDNLPEHFRVGGPGIPSSGPSMLTSIFGDKFGSVANTVSSFTGSKGATTSSLFGIIMPLALGLLGKYATENHSNSGSIASLLSSQKSTFQHAIPSGLAIGSILGLSAAPTMAATSAKSETKKSTGWLVPVLLILAGLLLLWWLFKTCNKPKEEVTVVDTTTTVQTPAPTAPPVVERVSLKLKLPDGVELDAYEGGIEDRFLKFLQDPNAKPGKDVWFDFRDLNFEFATANIVPESRSELDNIAKILKAYPNVKVKIGGYTDRVGDSVSNMKLSQDRADAVFESLTSAGVGKQILAAEGYGSQFAKFPADAPESDRITDRHVSVSPREK